MKEFIENLEFYIDQYEWEKQIFHMGVEIKIRGWMNKREFLSICLWKSRRPKKLYELNTNEGIITKSKLAFKEKDEFRKIQLLTELEGVGIPTASAILSVVNPEKYPIIDERCIQTFRKFGIIDWKIITANRWIEYLNIIRKLAKNNNKTAREIEKALFAYNRINLDKQYKNLYN